MQGLIVTDWVKRWPEGVAELVKWNKEGKLKFKEDVNRDQRVGLELPGKRIPREHFPVMSGANVIGEVSSGTFSPTLERPIAMAYVRPQYAGLGTELAIDIRGRPEPARVVALPFYSRITR